MSNGLAKIRSKWFEGTPVEKTGVTERYVVFGEARRWILDHLNLRADSVILDVGFGHGFLSFEMASRTEASVIGLDFLKGEQLKVAAGGARIGGLRHRISWVTGDARMIPFQNNTFDFVVSFLSLQDIFMTGGEAAVRRALENSFRVLRPKGIIAFGDNLFPECSDNDSQRLYSRIHREEFGAALPRRDTVIRMLERLGLGNLTQSYYDPRIKLDKGESRIELMDIVEAHPFGLELDFEKLWDKYEREIEKSGLSYPRLLLIMGTKG